MNTEAIAGEGEKEDKRKHKYDASQKQTLVEKGQWSRPGQPISPGSIQNRDQWGHWTRFVSPGGRPGHVGHWSRFIWTFWSRLVG